MDLNGFNHHLSGGKHCVAVLNPLWRNWGVIPDHRLDALEVASDWTSHDHGLVTEWSQPGYRLAHACQRAGSAARSRDLRREYQTACILLLAASLVWRPAHLIEARPAPSGQRDAVPDDGGACTRRAAGSPLSERETAILRCISVGCSNKEAARELGISPSTVRTHVESVFRKLQCTTRAAATLKAKSMALI